MRLLNFRLLDGTGRDDACASLTIGEDGRIANVTRGAGPPAEPGALDLSGHTVLPGLFDCHVHLVADASTNPFDTSRDPTSAHFGILGAVNAGRLLRRGITTARDLGAHHFTDVAIKRAIESGLIPGPRLLTSGKILTMTGGHGWLFGQEVDGVDEVRKYARLNLKMGADNIKMVASGGVLTPGVNPCAASLSEEELAAGFAEAAKGRAADLLVVKGDPLQDLRIPREPALVFKEGWRVPLEKLDLEVPKQKLQASDPWAAAEKFLAQGCACC
jgi:imidazolonepropionase-like amidohydrolase